MTFRPESRLTIGGRTLRIDQIEKIIFGDDHAEVYTWDGDGDERVITVVGEDARALLQRLGETKRPDADLVLPFPLLPRDREV